MSEELVDITTECFGYKDGRVICWRGVNYVRQEAAREAIQQAAGFGAACIMSKPGLAREVVMPTEELIEGCERIFQEINDGTIAGSGPDSEEPITNQ